MSLKLSPDHPQMLNSRFNLARAYWIAGRVSEAVALSEATLALRLSKPGADHPDTLFTRTVLAVAYQSLGRWTDAEAQWREMLARRRKTVGPSSPLLAGDLGRLGRNLLNQSNWLEAESVLRECLSILEKALPNDWRRFTAMSRLGGALMGQRRYAEAEPLVVQGYEGMKLHEARIPAGGFNILLEAADQVVALYEAWDKPRQATEWKEKLGLADLPAKVFASP
jgi:eukaryotic-like serine/threonine-protein kinase